MASTVFKLVRPLVPNLTLKIPHVESQLKLRVRLRQHLRLVARGTKAYEKKYVSVLRHLINEGDTVFDIGANIGFYTVLFSSWVGKKGRVLAYEPDQKNLYLLKRNLQLNSCKNAVIRELALGRNSGIALLSLDIATEPTGHFGTGVLFGETIFGRGRTSFIKVDVRTLDDEASRWGFPQVIKLDVEGGEFDVLVGGLKLLEKHRPILISELSVWNESESNGPSRAALATKLLEERDYSLWDVDTGSRVSGGDVSWTILAVPNEKCSDDRVAIILNGVIGADVANH